MNIFIQDTKVLGGGVTIVDNFSLGNFMMKSSNLRDWTFPVMLGHKFNYQVNYKTNEPLKLNIVSGLSGYEYRMILLKYQFDPRRQEYIDVIKKSDVIDLSDDIVSYQNKGNERITLTLGNYE